MESLNEKKEKKSLGGIEPSITEFNLTVVGDFVHGNFVHTILSFQFCAWNFVHGKFCAQEILCKMRNLVHGNFVHGNFVHKKGDFVHVHIFFRNYVHREKFRAHDIWNIRNYVHGDYVHRNNVHRQFWGSIMCTGDFVHGNFVHGNFVHGDFVHNKEMTKRSFFNEVWY